MKDSTEKSNMRRSEAAQYLRERFGFGTTQWLAKLAVVGGGPKYRKIGRYPIYNTSDLIEWINARTSPLIDSTSQHV